MSIRMRHTRWQSGSRRSHHALKNINIVADKDGNLRLPHRLDETTGMYRGKLIVEPKAKAVKEPKGKKVIKVKAEKEHTHEHAHAEHSNAEAKSTKGVSGMVATGGRPKARSGMGGGV